MNLSPMAFYVTYTCTSPTAQGPLRLCLLDHCQQEVLLGWLLRELQLKALVGLSGAAGVVAARWGSVALGGQGGLRWKGWWWCVGLSGGRVQYSSPPCNPGKGTGQPAPWPKGAWGERPHCKSGMTKGACGTEWCARLQV